MITYHQCQDDFFVYINMSTLQHTFIRTSILLFMGLKTRWKQSEYFTRWRVHMEHML